MPALQVKNCPNEVYEQLRACASEENRSRSQQTLTILKEYLSARAAVTTRHAEPGSQAPASHVASAQSADFIAKRRKLFSEINELPAIPVTEESPSTADILASVREEDAR